MNTNGYVRWSVYHIFCIFFPGNKMNNVGIVYTMWENLKKTPSMDVGQVGFHKQREVITASTCTVGPPYNVVIFLQNTHKRHSIACPHGQAMECLLWVESLICIQGSFCVCAQPMKDDITMYHCLSLDWRINKIIHVYQTLVIVTYVILSYNRQCYQMYM